MVHNYEACHYCGCGEWLDDLFWGQCSMHGCDYQECYSECSLNESITEKNKLGGDGECDQDEDGYNN